MFFLVIKTFEENNNNISNELKEIFKIKMDIHNLLYEKFKIHNHKCELLTEEKEIKDYFKDLYLYISPLMKKLWNNPKSIANILLNADKNELENYLAHFVTHNLYENLFSSNGKEEQLIYIIALLLKKEINNFQSNILLLYY